MNSGKETDGAEAKRDGLFSTPNKRGSRPTPPRREAAIHPQMQGVRQRQKDGTYYINNITNNIVVEKKQEEIQ